jgi:hypothetical protein
MINSTALLSFVSAGSAQGPPAAPVTIGPGDQEVQVLLLSLGAATLIQALPLTGVLRGFLRLAAGLLFIVAALWPTAALLLPDLAGTARQLAGSVWAWLVLVLVVISVNALLPALRRGS